MNPFLNACGTRRPLQIEVENRISHRVEIRSLDQPFAVIGRDRDCDIVLNDKQVSRRHAYLQIIGGRVYWVDLDSRTGTFASGEELKSGRLGGDRVIGIGPNDVRHFDGAENLPAGSAADPPKGSPLIWRSYGEEPLTDVTIEFLNGPSESKSWPVRRVLSLIGTAKRCKFRLADRSVEPFQCALVKTPQGAFVVDLLGGNGVIVNESPARWALLRDGDLLQVGRYKIRMHCSDSKTESAQISAAQPGPDALTGTPRLGLSSQQGEYLPVPLPSFPVVANPVTSGTELLSFPPGLGFPAPTVSNELNESVLVPLVSQFGMMQQQMFDQFQQTMHALVQMFGKMHQNQMEMIQQEFGRLNELTKEINELKSELAEMSRKQAESPLPSQPRPTAAPLQPTAPNPAAMRKPRRSAELTESGASPKPRPSPASEETGPGERDMIVWLHQRIANIQDERETRWQKLLKLLPGSS